MSEIYGLVCEVCESGTTDSMIIDKGTELVLACRPCWVDYNQDATINSEDTVVEGDNK